jgi:hypothetical protein
MLRTRRSIWGQKDIRYLNVWSDLVACSNLGFHSNENFIGAFSGGYNELKDKPSFTQVAYYESVSFFPDKSLTLIAQSNNTISGLNIDTSGTQLSHFRADRIVCTGMPVLNGPISQVGTPELSHQAANKGYVDYWFIAYTPTDQMISQFKAL